MFLFQHPAVLFALVPLAPLCAWKAGGVARFLARIGVIAALLAAAAGPTRERTAEVRGLVVAAREVSPGLRPGELKGAPPAALSVEFADPADGIARAAALAGPGGAIVLATPARWSPERAAAALRESERAGVPVFLWSPPAPLPDAAAASLWVPSIPRENEAFEVLAEVQGLPGARGEALLLADDVPAGRAAYEGRESRLRFTATLGAGYHRLALRLEPAVDGEDRNNLALGGVEVFGAPRVLVIEGTRGAGSQLAAALAAQGIAVDRADPSAAPTWEDFAAVVLARVDPFRLAGADSLAQSVAAGTGLWAIVSPREADAWNRHDLAKLLPLTFRAPDATPPPPDPGTDTGPPAPSDETPRVLLVLVIDRSGSMQGPQLTAAKEASIAAAETLQDGDRVGVVAFDSEAHWVLEPTDATARESIADAISKLQAGGETDVLAGMTAAAGKMRGVKIPVRHMIVMTDGMTPSADFRKLVEGLAAEGITVSTVGLGTEFDGALLANVAQWGHGRFYFTSRADEIPRIFTLETRRIAAGAPAPKVKPGPKPPPTPPKAIDFLPVLAAEADPATEGFSEWPPIAGVAGDTAREDARLLLKAGSRPLLAVRRISLGKAAAFAAALDGPEAAKWTAWERFPALTAQLVRTLMRAEAAGPSIEVRPEGDCRCIVVRTTGEAPHVSADGEALVLEKLAGNAWSTTLQPAAFPHFVRIDAATAAGHSSAAAGWNWPEALTPRAAAVLPFPAWSEAAVEARPAAKRTEREDLSGWPLAFAIGFMTLEVWLRRKR